MKIIQALKLLSEILESVEKLRFDWIVETKLDVRESNSHCCFSTRRLTSIINILTDYNMAIYDEDMGKRMNQKDSLEDIKPESLINVYWLEDIFLGLGWYYYIIT